MCRNICKSNSEYFVSMKVKTTHPTKAFKKIDFKIFSCYSQCSSCKYFYGVAKLVICCLVTELYQLNDWFTLNETFHWLSFPPKLHNCVLLKRFPFLTVISQLPSFFTRYTKRSYVPFVRGRIYTLLLTFLLLNIISKIVIALAANSNNSLSSTNYFKHQNRVNLQLYPGITYT